MLLWTHNYTWGPAFFLCTLLSLSFLSDLLHLWFPTSPSRCLDLKLHSCGWRAGRHEPRVPGYFEPGGETRLPGRLCNLFFSSLLSYERTYIHAARSSESGELVWLYICRIKCIYRLRSDEEGEFENWRKERFDVMDQNKYVRHLAICTRGIPKGLISQQWWAGLLVWKWFTLLGENRWRSFFPSLALLRLSGLAIALLLLMLVLLWIFYKMPSLVSLMLSVSCCCWCPLGV